MTKFINIFIILLEYPLLLIKTVGLKEDYIKLKNTILLQIKNQMEINKLKDYIELILTKFLTENKNNLSQKEIDYFTFLIQFIFVLELLSKKYKILYTDIDLMHFISIQQTHFEKNMLEAKQYGFELNQELERISLDVSLLLNTITELKKKLSLEESKSEVLLTTKGSLEKKLAKEKRKTKKLTK